MTLLPTKLGDLDFTREPILLPPSAPARGRRSDGVRAALALPALGSSAPAASSPFPARGGIHQTSVSGDVVIRGWRVGTSHGGRHLADR